MPGRRCIKPPTAASLPLIAPTRFSKGAERQHPCEHQSISPLNNGARGHSARLPSLLSLAGLTPEICCVYDKCAITDLTLNDRTGKM